MGHHYRFAAGETSVEAFVADMDGDRTLVCTRVYNPPHVQCAGAVVEGVFQALIGTVQTSSPYWASVSAICFKPS